MPKCGKWLPSTNAVPPPNGLKELFKRHMRAKGVTYSELANVLHKSSESVRSQMSRGTWNYRDIQAWAIALDIGADELGAALMYGAKGRKAKVS